MSLPVGPEHVHDSCTAKYPQPTDEVLYTSGLGSTDGVRFILSQVQTATPQLPPWKPNTWYQQFNRNLRKR